MVAKTSNPAFVWALACRPTGAQSILERENDQAPQCSRILPAVQNMDGVPGISTTDGLTAPSGHEQTMSKTWRWANDGTLTSISQSANATDLLEPGMPIEPGMRTHS